MKSLEQLRPVTKFSTEIEAADTINEVVANAFRIAESRRPSAAFINARQGIMVGEGHEEADAGITLLNPGAADTFAIGEAAELINGTERPVVLLGLLASQS